MIELKPLKRIMLEYKALLEKYENCLAEFTNADFKKLIGEIKLFWHRHQKFVDYFCINISSEDEVAFLAGAVRLDVVNDGQYEFILVGKCRVINDPIYKMSSFYGANEDEVNFEYTNRYLQENIRDILTILREYPDDFYILPVDFTNTSESCEHRRVLVQAAEKMMLSMFVPMYDNVGDMVAQNKTYENIEDNLLPYIKTQLVFNSLKDTKLSLREKCIKYIQENGEKFPLITNMSEVQIFVILVTQFCMQMLAIMSITKNYHMIPFIRNDVVFQYFHIFFHSSIMREELTQKEYLNTYIPYVIQKVFDFSDREYEYVKTNLGNGKLIHAVIEIMDEEKIPLPNEVIESVNKYVDDIKVTKVTT